MNEVKFGFDTRTEVDTEAKHTNSRLILKLGYNDKFELVVSYPEEIDRSKDPLVTETTGSLGTSHELEASTAVSYTKNSPTVANEFAESRVGEDPLTSESLAMNIPMLRLLQNLSSWRNSKLYRCIFRQ